MTKEEAQELLRRYRLGQCTPREVEIINRWYESLAGGWSDTGFAKEAEVQEVKKEMLEAITHRIDESEEAFGGAPRVRRMSFPVMRYVYRMAAVFAVGVAVAVFLYGRQDPVAAVSQEVAVDESSRAPAPAYVYLSDGSVVWLKGGSTLDYPENFDGATREVTLRGEAFFEVAKDQNRPFIIHTAHLTTRVLGTSFNIHDSENADSMEVAVMTGRVAVSVKNASVEEPEEIILTPNQKAVYSRNRNMIVPTTTDEVRSFESISASKFVFSDVSLATIVFLLNDRYNVAITLGSEKMNDCIITADLSAESLTTSLEILSKATGSEFVVSEDSILLDGPGCQIDP